MGLDMPSEKEAGGKLSLAGNRGMPAGVQLIKHRYPSALAFHSLRNNKIELEAGQSNS